LCDSSIWILTNRQRATLLPVHQQLLSGEGKVAVARKPELTDIVLLCPACHTGHLQAILWVCVVRVSQSPPAEPLIASEL
jgi:hypothetical protein